MTGDFRAIPMKRVRTKTYSMDSLPQEFPSLGTGDYRTPACIIKNTDRTYCSDFRYVSHRIREGEVFSSRASLRCTRRRMRLRVWRSCCVIR